VPHDVQRILDANANRAREAMRVMEDAARFVFNDAKLAGDLKRLRHDFRQAIEQLPARYALELHRDTPGDVGTALSTDSEARRESVRAVAVAAGKRLSEALRCLGEYGKTLDGAFADAVEAVRYRGYDLETRLHRAMGAGPLPQWRVCVLLTADQCVHHDWLDVAEAAVAGGADCLQLREKRLEAGPLCDRATQLIERVDGQAAVIINDRLDVALASGADGVHLGTDDLPLDAARKLAGRSLWIGASTHSLAEAKRAVAAGADYCGVGMVFGSSTKHRRRSGLDYVRRFVARYGDVRHLAIGGIGPDNIAQVVEAGAKGVAVSASVCGAAKPEQVVRRLRRALAG
jgi:thiamine-phosphate pyrophosphorylase